MRAPLADLALLCLLLQLQPVPTHDWLLASSPPVRGLKEPASPQLENHTSAHVTSQVMWPEVAVKLRKHLPIRACLALCCFMIRSLIDQDPAQDDRTRNMHIE